MNLTPQNEAIKLEATAIKRCMEARRVLLTRVRNPYNAKANAFNVAADAAAALQEWRSACEWYGEIHYQAAGLKIPAVEIRLETARKAKIALEAYLNGKVLLDDSTTRFGVFLDLMTEVENARKAVYDTLREYGRSWL